MIFSSGDSNELIHSSRPITEPSQNPNSAASETIAGAAPQATALQVAEPIEAPTHISAGSEGLLRFRLARRSVSTALRTLVRND